MHVYDTLVLGGGQAGLATAYYLRRHKVDYLVLDNKAQAGGSWLNTWDSLTLFSPSTYSSLPGWSMPISQNTYPSKQEFIAYLEAYEERYSLNLERSIQVTRVTKEGELFRVETIQGNYYLAKTLISATGTASKPFVPHYPNQEKFEGLQLHSVNYRNPAPFIGKKTLVVGGGNSGAQLMAELLKHTQTKWTTLQPPHFLPPEIDGRYLFEQATQAYYNMLQNKTPTRQASLADIVLVESIREAYYAQKMKATPMFSSFYEKGVNWSDNSMEEFDAILWCTGFKSALDHLSSLNIVQNGRIITKGTRSVAEPKLWLVGYGNWTGFASATIYGVGKTARETVKELLEVL